MDSDAMPILHETLGTIREILGPELDGITVERAVVGLFFTGVELSNGIAGACATPIKTIPEAVCCPSSAMAMPFPGKLRGRPAFDLAREALGDNGIRRAVGIAAMNALADTCWRRRPHPETELRLGIDAFDATEIRPGDTVVVVGAFVPFLRELKRRRQPYLVLEQDPATLKPDELPFFRPAEQAATVVPEADVLLITGTTLINDTLEELLALAKPAARVTMVGPTVSLLPDAFLRRGADILGTVRITDPDAFLDMLAEGGSGYHFLGRTAQKVVLVRRSVVGAVAAKVQSGGAKSRPGAGAAATPDQVSAHSPRCDSSSCSVFALALWPTRHNCARTDNSAGCAPLRDPASGLGNRPCRVASRRSTATRQMTPLRRNRTWTWDAGWGCR